MRLLTAFGRLVLALGAVLFGVGIDASAQQAASWESLVERAAEKSRGDRHREAEPLWKEALRVSDEFAADDPRRLVVLSNLAMTYLEIGRLDLAEHYYRRAVENAGVLRDDGDQEEMLRRLAFVYEELGRHSDAAGAFRRVKELQLKRGEPASAIATTMQSIAVASEAEGDAHAAEGSYQEALRLLDPPTDAGSRRQITTVLLGLGTLLVNEEDYGGAEAVLQRGLRLLGTENRDSSLEAGFLLQLARVRRQAGREGEAGMMERRAHTILDVLRAKTADGAIIKPYHPSPRQHDGN